MTTPTEEKPRCEKCGKIIYQTNAEAVEESDRLRKRRSAAMFMPYFSAKCGYYHLHSGKGFRRIRG